MQKHDTTTKRIRGGRYMIYRRTDHTGFIAQKQWRGGWLLENDETLKSEPCPTLNNCVATVAYGWGVAKLNRGNTPC